MDNELNNIGEAYRKAFSDFREEPPAGNWERLESDPRLINLSKPRFFTPKRLIFGTAGLALLATLVYLSTNRLEQPKESVTKEVPQLHAARNPETTDAGLTTPGVKIESVDAGSKAVSPGLENPPTDLAPQKKITGSGDFRQETKPAATVDPVAGLSNTAKVPSPIPVITETMGAKPVKNNKGSSAAVSSIAGDPGSNNPVEFSPDATICTGQSVYIWASGGSSCIWSTGDTTDTISVNPSLTMIYTVTVTDEFGKPTIGTITVTVTECSGLYIPKAFTPNNDGLNDEFLVKGSDISNFSIIIGSRNGQIIYESKDISRGWDGKLNGKPVEPGVYIYYIHYTDATGTGRKKTGHLTLLR